MIKTLLMNVLHCKTTNIPAGTRRLYNVGSTSMQRHDVASTLKRRCIYVICPLGLLYRKCAVKRSEALSLPCKRVLMIVRSDCTNAEVALNKVIFQTYEGESISNQPIPFPMDRDGHDFQGLF